MPPTRNMRSSDPEVDHGRRKRTQVMDQVHKVVSKGFEAAGVFLGARFDISMLENILDDVDTTGLQSEAVDTLDDRVLSERTDRTDLAMVAMRDLSTVLKALHAAHRTRRYPRLQPLMDQCLKMLHERWGDVANCIMFMGQILTPSDAEWLVVIPACLLVLEPLLYQPEKNQYQQDIIEMRATVDVVFYFARLTDANTGRPITLQPSPGSVCVIAKVFEFYVASEAGAESLSSRMESLPPNSRKEIVQAFVRRIQGVLAGSREEPTQAQTTQTLFGLIRATCGLLTPMAPGDEYAHRKLLFEATRVLSRFAEGAGTKTLTRIDPTIMNACVNDLCSVARKKGMSAHVMERLLEGGMIPCLLRSLPYAVTGDHPWQGVRGQACDILPFMTDSRCFNAARKGGANRKLFKELEEHPKATSYQSIYNAFSLAFRCGESAFSSDRKGVVQMCYNVKHQLPLEGSDNSPVLRTCGSCHAVFYCSKECQEEDWAALHRQECRPASLHWRQKLKAAGVTQRVEQDRLAFLEVLANNFLSAPSDARSSQIVELEQSPGGRAARTEDTFVHVFDTAGMRNSLDRTSSLKFFKYEHMSISAFLKKYDQEVGESTQARIFQCAEDVMRFPESTSLVTGMFLASPRVVITICAKMQYAEGAASGQRYRVVSHACCVLTLIGL